MAITAIIKKGEYFDSVSLMIVSKKITNLEGVKDSAIVMGTKENLSILKNADLMSDEFNEVNDTDLLIAIRLESDKNSKDIISIVEHELKELKNKSKNKSSTSIAINIDDALKKMEDANLALISVAGKYAFNESMKALDKNLNVMLFSDNVSLKDEIELKTYAKEKNLLFMGPDCGTCIINGAPLGFANVVNPGNIGIVAAAGTGLQEVSTIISNNGGGISQAIGTGGRDTKEEVGGITFLMAIEALKNDPKTKGILLVSKPPHPSVVEKINQSIKNCNKPIVSVFLGEGKTLEDGAFEILEETGIKIETQQGQLPNNIKTNSNSKFLRALYTGGTYCYETQYILSELDKLYSNVPFGKASKLKNTNNSQCHTIIDFGEDEFTVGRPHPMIDFSLRNKRIVKESKDPKTAIILLDLVLGYGSNMNPLEDILPTLKEAIEYVPIIMSVTGTNLDPQNRVEVINTLQDIGIIVCPSNAQAAKLTLKVLKKLEN